MPVPARCSSLLWPGDFLTSIIYRSLLPATLAETLVFPPWILRREVSSSSLSLKEGHKTWNAQEGSHRSKAICTQPLSLPPSSSSSSFFVSRSFSFWYRGEGMMEQWISRALGAGGSVPISAHVCSGRVKRFRGGGGGGLPSRAVSHHAADPPGSFRCPSGFIILLSS